MQHEIMIRLHHHCSPPQPYLTGSRHSFSQTAVITRLHNNAYFKTRFFTFFWYDGLGRFFFFFFEQVTCQTAYFQKLQTEIGDMCLFLFFQRLCKCCSPGWKIHNKVFHPSTNCPLPDCRGFPTHPRCPSLQPCPSVPWGGSGGTFSLGGIYNPFSIYWVRPSVSFKLHVPPFSAKYRRFYSGSEFQTSDSLSSWTCTGGWAQTSGRQTNSGWLQPQFPLYTNWKSRTFCLEAQLTHQFTCLDVYTCCDVNHLS